MRRLPSLRRSGLTVSACPTMTRRAAGRQSARATPRPSRGSALLHALPAQDATRSSAPFCSGCRPSRGRKTRTLEGIERRVQASDRIWHGERTARRATASASVSGAAGTLSTKSANISDRLLSMTTGGSPVMSRQRAMKSAAGMRSRALARGETWSAGKGAKVFMIAETGRAFSWFSRLHRTV
jgi:hypothetical protein